MNASSSIKMSTKPLKVLHITYDMRIGGTEMVIKNIIDGSNKQQFAMSVLCIESPLGPFAKDLINDGIPFYELNRQPGFDKKLIADIRKIIIDNKIDRLHCHQYTPWVYGVVAAMFTRTKVIFTEHGRFYPDSSTWKRKLVNPLLNLFTAQVTAISKATKHALTEFENIPSRSINVLYNGISPMAFNADKANALKASFGIPENHLVLGTVARFDPIKNHKMMLSAFAKVIEQHQNCTLLIVGDGDERENIEQCIEQLDLTNHVILVGYEPKPAEHIAIMDVFLLSSLSEGTSMTLLEAMSIGKPCVVTNTGGNPEIIIDGKNGFVTPNNDATAFSQAICKLLSSPELLTQYGVQGKAIFNQSFHEHTMNEQFASLYLSKA